MSVAVGANSLARARVMGPQAGVSALLVVLGVLPLLGTPTLVVQVTDIMIFVLLVVSLNLLIGYAGLLSFGHAAFFGLGGYVAGILDKFLDLNMPLAFLAGPVAAAGAALVIGFFSVPLTHSYLIMLTFAFGQLIYTAIWKWYDLTGGDDGLIGITPAPALVGGWSYYYFTFAVVLVSVAILYRVCLSPFGQVLKAIKDNPRRTEFIGINVRRHQLVAFVLAGFVAGVAGALQVFFNRGMFPGSAHWVLTADAWIGLVLGGTGHFAGPIVGAAVFKVLGIIFPRYTEYWLFVQGLIVLAVALMLPHGLISLPRLWGQRRQKNA